VRETACRLSAGDWVPQDSRQRRRVRREFRWICGAHVWTRVPQPTPPDAGLAYVDDFA